MRNLALGEEVEIIDQRRHGRVVAVNFLRLQRNAFSETARSHAGGIEGVDHRQHGLCISERYAEPVSGLQQVRLQITCVVDLADQLFGDEERFAAEHCARLMKQMLIKADVWRSETIKVRTFAAGGRA
jgi:hypothetical protein